VKCPAKSSSAWPSRAVTKRPDLLLRDEPTGALDCTTVRLVLTALDRVHHELGATTAIITHNAPIASMAHRVLSMADATITADRANAERASPESLNW